MSSNAYWLLWNESKYACVSLSHGMLLSVVVDMEVVHLDGWRSCWCCGLCEVNWLMLLNMTGWVKSGGRVEHGGLCEVDGLMLSELSRSDVAILWQLEVVFKVPFFPFNAPSFLVECLSAISDSSSAASWRTNRHILKFLLFMGVSPNLFGHLPISGGMKKYAFLNSLFYLFVSFQWSRLIFVISREVLNIRNVFSIVSFNTKGSILIVIGVL